MLLLNVKGQYLLLKNKLNKFNLIYSTDLFRSILDDFSSPPSPAYFLPEEVKHQMRIQMKGEHGGGGLDI